MMITVVRPAFLILVTAMLLMPSCAVAQDTDEEYPDANFFVGRYTLIGKILEGDETFMGLLILSADTSGPRSFMRILGADTTRGTWAMES